ncbi:ribonuclease Y [Blastopirellula sp. J2-11]|uniref:ribonuclease Y n=1 Tax=Blastopirellula sp. J2-11 TaxID=2943192 RepID=UPI0021C59096|nr:ribonuclease Y [Blastopirellula sp. J2-11]UUO08598.1 ribonuclease Y [Blastopirellula sp. J2-11]
MPDAITYAIFAVVGFVLAIVLVKIIDRLRKKDAETEAQLILDRAKQDSENLLKEAKIQAKEEAIDHKAKAESDLNRSRDEIREREKSLDRREEAIEQQANHLRKQEHMVETKERRLTEKIEDTGRKAEELKAITREQQERLHKMSGLNRDEAKTELLRLLDQELQGETGALILKHQRRIEETCKQQAQDMLLTAIQRFAAAHTAESTTSAIDIPTDDIKGRIIGREGRNIRSFEKETGVDVIIDDTPGVVIVSGFDPVRREIARISLNKLIADGRIHPTRIEEVVKETQGEIEDVINKKGEEAASEADVMGLHPRLIHMLGRLHFRTSYSQNVLRHSIEVGFIAGMLAEMIGLDARIARRAGLLHDIGKAADHELEGGHPKIGADLLKRHGESPEVVHAAFGHHDEIITEYPYTMLVATADATSASRPGARRETLERYIKRMEELESIARGFNGVEQAFAIQAGRELRVIASSRDTDDEKAAKISRDIAKAFEDQLTYPGEIKVTVVRESRFTEFAR